MADVTNLNFPQSPGDWLVVGLALLLATWGGAIQYFSRWRRTPRHKFTFSWIELIGELATSGFAGLLIYIVTLVFGGSAVVGVVLAAIAGHMGSRSLFLLERKALEKLHVDEVALKDMRHIDDPPSGLPGKDR